SSCFRRGAPIMTEHQAPRRLPFPLLLFRTRKSLPGHPQFRPPAWVWKLHSQAAARAKHIAVIRFRPGLSLTHLAASRRKGATDSNKLPPCLCLLASGMYVYWSSLVFYLANVNVWDGKYKLNIRYARHD